MQVVTFKASCLQPHWVTHHIAYYLPFKVLPGLLFPKTHRSCWDYKNLPKKIICLFLLPFSNQLEREDEKQEENAPEFIKVKENLRRTSTTLTGAE